MKFTIEQSKLVKPLQQINSIIEKRQTMPILSNIMLVVENNTLMMTGTDLELQLVASIKLENAINGEITVPARKLLDLVRQLPSDSIIKIETAEDDKIKLSSNRSKFSLSTLPAQNYPEFSSSEMPNSFIINAGKLKSALEKTMFCMANQDVRYYLNGLMLEIFNSKLKLVASDGHRLSIYKDEMDVETGYEERIIIPRKGVIELARLLDDPEAELNVQFSSNNIRIYIKELIFSAKLVDAKYPDFSKVFEQAFFSPIIIPKQQFKETLTRVSVLANEKFKGVTFDITENLLKVTTHNPEHDEGEEELAIDYQGEPLIIAFNAAYLLDAIANLDGGKASLTIAANASSCFIEEPNQEAYKFIVMPMRL